MPWGSRRGRRWPSAALPCSPSLSGASSSTAPTCPLDTDTRIAVALVAALADARPDVVAAPPVAYGASGEHAGFPGTLSIGTEALTTVLVELGRSADAFSGVVFVNGHGGNLEAVRRATALLVDEGRRVLAWAPSVPGGDAHAGRTETSLLLALDPGCVRLDRAEPGATAPLSDLIDDLRHGRGGRGRPQRRARRPHRRRRPTRAPPCSKRSRPTSSPPSTDGSPDERPPASERLRRAGRAPLRARPVGRGPLRWSGAARRLAAARRAPHRRRCRGRPPGPRRRARTRPAGPPPRWCGACSTAASSTPCPSRGRSAPMT